MSTGSTNRRGKGLFGFRRSSLSDDILSSINREPSIINARQKVTDAEVAERNADDALSAARMAIREAKQHVRNLEQEALEEYVSCVCMVLSDSADT